MPQPPSIKGKALAVAPQPAARASLPPTDVLKQVLTQLGPEDAYQAAKAHPDFYRAAKDPSVWVSIAGPTAQGPALVDDKVLADLRSTPVGRGIKKGAYMAGASVWGVPALLAGGITSRAAQQGKANRAAGQKIASQARNDEMLLLPRLHELGVDVTELPSASLPKQVSLLRKAEDQRSQLTKHLKLQLLRHDWNRVTEIVKILGADAPLQLQSKQLDAIANKAAGAGELALARWLVSRGAKVSPRLLERLAKLVLTRVDDGNHLVALGATLPNYEWLVGGTFRSSPHLDEKNRVFLGALSQIDVNQDEINDPKRWPQEIVSNINPAYSEALSGNNANIQQLAARVLRETTRLPTRAAATGDVKTAQRDLAVYQEVLRRVLDSVKTHIVENVQNTVPTTDAAQSAAIKHIEGDFLAHDSNTSSLKDLREALETTEVVARSLATHQIHAPLRDLLTEKAHAHADDEHWSTLQLMFLSGLPTAIPDAGGVSLADKLQTHFNDLIHGNRLTQAVTMAHSLGQQNVISGHPMRAQIDAGLSRVLEARDWKAAKQWVQLGADLRAVVPGHQPSAHDRIAAYMAAAIGAGRVDELEQLLDVMPTPPPLPWNDIAKAAFQGTFLPRRLPVVFFQPNLLQTRVMRALSDAIAANAWASANQFVQCGVPLSRSAVTNLSAAWRVASRASDIRMMAKLAKFKATASFATHV